MASNSNNHSAHPEFDPNLIIKAEPGMESESSASTSTTTSDSSLQSLIANIKVEPGNPIPNNRLPSLFARRDLTLGGNVKLEKPKRVFTPNINAQRLKNREDQNSVLKNEPTSKKERGRGRERAKNERERSKDGRGKGRGKAANNLVQSSGIFSDGLADLPGSRRSGSSHSSYRERNSCGSERESLLRPKLSHFKKLDRVEAEEKSKRILTDDFDDGMDVDEDEGSAPLTLPMVNKAKISTLKNHKTELESNSESTHSAKLLNGQVIEPNEGKSTVLPKVEKETKETVTVTQVLEKNNKSSNFILLQLPDCLPGLRGGDEKPGDPKVKHITEPAKESATENPKRFCALNDLKEGMLGKLQILRSGRARMILGDNNLIVELGSTVSFRQDLIAAKTNDTEHDLVNLGRINSTLICAPDWEDLLKIL